MLDDPSGREWVELSGMNASLVSQLRPVLVSLWGAKGESGQLAGSGFLIACSPGLGVVLTAKHVLDMVVDIQQPRKRHAQSALAEFLPATRSQPNVGGGNLTALWATDQYMLPLEVPFVSYNAVSDLAACLVVSKTEEATRFVAPSVPLETIPVRVGDIVHTASWNSMRQTPTSVGEVAGYEVYREMSLRRGTVTGIYPQGFRQYRWPCFTTSIPVEPGMSGGLVYLPRDGGPIGACGVICADNSSGEARHDQSVAGESVIGMSWMALGLQLPVTMSNDSPMRSIQQMMKDGDIPPAVGGSDQFSFLFSS